MLLTTTENIPGKQYEIIGIVKGNMIQTKNIGRDITQGLKSIVGGELKNYVKMMNDTCTCICVCGDTKLYERISQIEGEDNTLYWVQDCSAASQNILLAAHAIGLAAVWTGIFPLQSRITKLQRLLALPENIVPLNLIVIGHPAAEAEPKNKWDEKKVHHNKF